MTPATRLQCQRALPPLLAGALFVSHSCVLVPREVLRRAVQASVADLLDGAAANPQVRTCGQAPGCLCAAP